MHYIDTRRTIDANANKEPLLSMALEGLPDFLLVPHVSKRHVMAKCHSLEKKNQKFLKQDLLIKIVKGNVKVDNNKVVCTVCT